MHFWNATMSLAYLRAAPSWRSRVSPFIAKPVYLFLARVFCTQMEIETSPALLSSGRAAAMRREALDSAEQSIIADYARGRGSIDAPANTIQGLACADKLPSDGRRFRHSISNRPRADTTLDRP